MIHYFDRSVRAQVRKESKKDHVPIAGEDEEEDADANTETSAAKEESKGGVADLGAS